MTKAIRLLETIIVGVLGAYSGYHIFLKIAIELSNNTIILNNIIIGG